MRNGLMGRSALAFVAAALLASGAAAAPNDSQSTPLPTLRIVPGQGIGPYSLRAGLDGLVRTIGTEGMHRTIVDMAEATRECDRRTTGRLIRLEWRQLGLWLTADEASRAVRVLSAYGTEQRFVTDRGVRLGSSADAVARLYGGDFDRISCRVPRADATAVIFRYTTLGIQFTAAYGSALGGGRLFEIGVFAPGTF
ncbi:MAG: hypothetical protein QN163_06310 [Armatimonadota bacterium]|nr:hypothetical protein [Armatimonadota bacterium]